MFGFKKTHHKADFVTAEFVRVGDQIRTSGAFVPVTTVHQDGPEIYINGEQHPYPHDELVYTKEQA